MQSEECRHIAGVSAAEAHSYAIFQLAGLLVAPTWRNDLSLAFPASDVAALEGTAVTAACIGLLGMAGALPYFYTEAVARSRNPAARAFVDMLAAPAVGAFCAAWRASRPEYVPLAALPAQQAPLRPRALGERLSQTLGVRVEVEQLTGGWHTLPPDKRSALGGAHPFCGAGALLGTRLWRPGSALRIHVGPLGIEAARDFLPGGAGASALVRLWRDFAGAAATDDGSLRTEACIHLLPEASKGARLGSGACLGHDALLMDRPAGGRDDLRYRLC